jgi:hypothetical protein
MKKFNKYGAAHKNIKQFDVEIIPNVDKNAVVYRIYSGEDDFYLFFLPNYETKQVEVSTDINTPFSDAALEFLINSGDVANVMKEVYNRTFQQVVQEQPKLMTLELPKLDLPELNYTFTK